MLTRIVISRYLMDSESNTLIFEIYLARLQSFENSCNTEENSSSIKET